MIIAPSAKNKSENSKLAVPKLAPSEASGTNAVVAVIVVPCTVLEPVKAPVTFNDDEFIVVTEVPCPIDIGTPDVAVPTVMPLDVLEQSILNVLVLSKDILEPSTTNVPSTSVLSRLETPSTLRLPLAVILATVPILPADEPTLNSNISPSSFQPIRALSELPRSISIPASHR